MFGNEDHMRLARNSGPQRQMACVATHDLYDLYPTMRAGGGPRSLDDFRDIAKGRVESQSVVGALKVLIDCLGNAHDLDAELSQLRRHAERVFTSTGDQCIKLQLGDILDSFRRSIFDFTRFRRL